MTAPVDSVPDAVLPDAGTRIWIVSHGGENHLLVREPLGGIDEWARGVDATVREYRLVRKFQVGGTTKAGDAVR
jgi:hypothetical protein